MTSIKKSRKHNKRLTKETAIAYGRLVGVELSEQGGAWTSLDLQVRTLNVIRSLELDKTIEPDVVFSPGGE